MQKLIYTLLGLCFLLNFTWAHVAMVYPKGGETIQGGSVLDIRWEVVIEHETLNWDLYYTLDDGATWDSIKTNIPVNSLGYSWEVPALNSKTVKIRVVQDNQLTDYDDITKNFTISSTTTAILHHQSLDLIIPMQPVRQELRFEVKGDDKSLSSITIFDIQGKALFVLPHTFTPVSLDIHALRPGMYILMVNRSSGRGAKKFIKV